MESALLTLSKVWLSLFVCRVLNSPSSSCLPCQRPTMPQAALGGVFPTPDPLLETAAALKLEIAVTHFSDLPLKWPSLRAMSRQPGPPGTV